MDINLTIDINIQKSLEREMDNINSMFNPDMALAIVANPKTGAILGISSSPSYDPNNYKNYSNEVLNRNLPIFSSYLFKLLLYYAENIKSRLIEI